MFSQSRSMNFGKNTLSLKEKVLRLNWLVLILICAVATIGFAMLYSAANASFNPWAQPQMIRFGVGFSMMIAIALVDIRHYLRAAYPLYFLSIALLIAVEVIGYKGMGAQRWLDLKIFYLQPSELMKISLILALARYFQSLYYEDVGRPLLLIFPLFLLVIPAWLVIRQPDLGTAVILLIIGGTVFFMAGVRLWKFLSLLLLGAGGIPVLWQYLHTYQKNRILSFMAPEKDPLGAGYHLMQSKIAMGSGGVFGKGFGQGTQSRLNFLPEKQTDFIFTMLAEEGGLVAGLGLMGLYISLIMLGVIIAVRCRNQFGRLIAIGVTINFSLFVLINMGMVMGMIPVVGVPLPLVSYGGTAMLTVLMGFGLLLNVDIHHHITHIGRADH